VLDWWKGQKQILFFKTTVSGMGEILSAVRECEKQTATACQTSAPDISSLQLALQKITEIQNTILERDRLLHRQEAVLCHSRFDTQSVCIKCPECNKEGKPLRNPLYSVHRPGHFVIYKRQTCIYCRGRHGFRPVDPNIPWFFGNLSSLQSTSLGYHWGERVQTMLKSSTSLTPQQQRPVDIICLHCQEDGEADNSSYTSVDRAPVWTLGNERSLYVEPQKDCQNCIKLKRVSGRWIPKDTAIPSISRYTLRTLADHYGHYDPYIITLFLDHWPPSSRRYRLGKDG
jgi:hypothetical protein